MGNLQYNNTVAVVGMACWYPDAKSLKELWENILARRIQFRKFLDQRMPMAEYHHPDRSEPDKTYGSRAAYIDGFSFDWAAHRIPLSTFKAMDTSHWLALDIALKAVSDASYAKETLPRDKTGVIIGNTLTGEQSRAGVMRLRWPFVKKVISKTLVSQGWSSQQIQMITQTAESNFKSVFPPANEDTLAGGLSNTIAGRICNYLDLHGGGYTVDGACSSSMIAVATAANGLISGDLDLALAGGVDISLDPFEIIGFAKTNALTMHEMTVYDRRGSGFIPGEGCGFVVLKRLEDAKRDKDYIYAVINGWGISSDGGGTGLTAPLARGQARSVRRAYDRAPYDMDSIDFIEGHGTGTTVGDKVELSSISQALESAPEVKGRCCGVTSLKSIIGHTKAASGIGAFIKGVLAVNRRVIPPIANCKEPHGIFTDQALHLYPVLTGESRPDESVIRAGISSMGFGGINCHITIASEDPPKSELKPLVDEDALMVSNQDTEIFLFSYDKHEDLFDRINEILAYSNAISQAELTDLSFKLCGLVDPGVRFKAAVVAGNPDELTTRLNDLLKIIEENPIPQQVVFNQSHTALFGCITMPLRIGMLFPGQGSQKMNMAHVLIRRFQWAKKMMDKADKLLETIGGSPVSQTIYHSLERAAGPGVAENWFRNLSNTQNAQPAICAVSAVWLEFLKKLGITPVASGGHSLGELTAFYAARAFDFSELIQLAAVRGRAMAAGDDQAGTMASLRCTRETAEKLVGKAAEYVVLANINGPEQMVVSGSLAGVDEVAKLAEEQQIKITRLEVSNAFHSRMIQNAADILADTDILSEHPASLDIQLFSSRNGQEVTSSTLLKKHFADQVVSQVDFPALIQAMSKACDLFIEVGSGRVLSGLTNAINGDNGPRCLPVESLPGADKDLNQLLAVLFVHNVDINWDILFAERLVRPFVSPDDKVFIDNPCEREIEGETAAPGSLSDSPASGMIDQYLIQTGQFDEAQIKDYLMARGGFLADVIRADVDNQGKDVEWGRPEKGILSKMLASEEAKSEAEPSDTSIEEILYSIVHEITGFALETLSPGLRLLDDLNMDSIKAGDMIVRFAGRAGAKGNIDAGQMSNVTLGEVLNTVSALIPDNVSSLVQSDIDVADILTAQISDMTGYSPDSLKSGMRLLDDLNMDSIKAGDLMVRLIKKTGIRQDLLDTSRLTNASLEEIAQAFDALMDTKGASQPVPQLDAALSALGPAQLGKTWVREFSAEFMEKELPSGIETSDWQNANILILYSKGMHTLADTLKDKFLDCSAQVRIEDYEHAIENQLTQNPNFSHFIAILPADLEETSKDIEALEQTIYYLASVAGLPSAIQRPITLAYIQFGRGFFGKSGELVDYRTCCAAALARSIHLERTDLLVRVLDFDKDVDSAEVSDRIIKELSSEESFVDAGYDAGFVRRVFVQKPLDPSGYQPRGIKWKSKDVILVTGGAKGITASCAFDLAQNTRTRMALVGRSPLPEEDVSGNEMVQVLARYEENGLEARYFSCDVSDPDAVDALVRTIEKEMGTVRGVVHGAGLNTPRLCRDVSAKDALSEVHPKIMGALNIIRALSDEPLKLFAAMNSIIGVTGMPGNAWYGFSNEVLDLILRHYQAQHASTQIISVAYSIWGEEGMGARMGSVNVLKQKGIDAIPSDEGIKRFTRLCLKYPGSALVAVTARLGGLDTFRIPALPRLANARYLEKEVYAIPGVESVFQAHLNLETDLYLVDHNFDGSLLLPTVLGLEAMAQVAACTAGLAHFSSRVRIENIRLERPVTVDPRDGADILIRALVMEKQNLAAQDTLRIRTWLSKSMSDLDVGYFSAEFVLGLEDEPNNGMIEKPDHPLPIDPVLDLYRPSLMFQGPRFQRMHRIWQINEKGDEANGAIFETRILADKETQAQAFDRPEHRNLVLPDPFFNDTLLQSAQMLTPKTASLPVFIKRWDIFPCEEPTPLSVLAQVEMGQRHEKEFDTTVTAVDSQGRVIEMLEHYTLRILKMHDDNPCARDLTAPENRDIQIIENTLKDLGQTFGFEQPALDLMYIQGIHDLKKKDRHEKQMPLIQNILEKVLQDESDDKHSWEVTWTDDGKPVIKGLENIMISLSHTDRLCICCAGQGSQGCDIAPVTPRERDHWESLLGKPFAPVLKQLKKDSDDLDIAGTRLWAVKEVLYKLGEKDPEPPSIETTGDKAVLFESVTARGPVHIVTILLELTWGSQLILALKVVPKALDLKDIPEGQGYDALKQHMEILTGPQGQNCISIRLPVTFRPNAQLSRTVYFSNYMFWAGEIREASIWPILRKVGEQFSSGEWGSVTNHSRLRILGEATAQDQIEIRLWADDNYGPADSTMDLKFDFLKVLPHGKFERLAFCEQTVTWVKIIDHGIVAPEPYPDYYYEFVKTMLPQNDNPKTPPAFPEPLEDLHKDDPDDKFQYEATPGPKVEPLLFEQVIETSLDHSNLVGNIYFANYYLWQGTARDRYFYQLIPEYYQGTGEKGELLCLETRINHLREAMPFNRIMVTMALKTLTRSRAMFYFEYFRVDQDDTRVKLAYGEQDAIWVTRDKQGNPAPALFPLQVVNALEKAISPEKL
ncbi:MAG: SDR family NAD(P)-dependent oxidoreductase [Desulfobacula sp.]|uniref:SDR family NAD(P)-dependent oxidoreductase n=1 Tax=Desulfobacula sp. TaxID=2593537 RepID=UPI0025BC26F9|nr:type I polyketide synthase [Desulfobacula sp.]MCD4719168.1 SDR family NAD(P)-dependent oxidoreductase [Desulfobacula sp.]